MHVDTPPPDDGLHEHQVPDASVFPTGDADRPREEPFLEVKAVSSNARAIAARYTGFTAVYDLHFGDGTRRENAQPGMFYMHTFDDPGSYTLTITHANAPTPIAHTPIWVRDNRRPNVEIADHPDGGPAQRLTFLADGPAWMISKGTIAWGDGTAAQDVVIREGDHVDHFYTAGDYTAVFEDSLTKRGVNLPVHAAVPAQDPVLTWEKDTTDPTGMTVKATITSAAEPARTLRIDWWDNSESPSVEDAKVGTAYAHAFPAGHTGRQLFSYGYADAGNAYAVELTLPLE